MTNEHDTEPHNPPKRELTYAEQSAARQKAFDDSIKAAKEEMAALIHTPQNSDTLESMLTRQSYILNGLFHKSLVANASPALGGIDFALRLQRECRQTVQALARVRRTNELTDRHAIDKKTGKRTDSPDRLYDAAGRLIYDFSGKN